MSVWLTGPTVMLESPRLPLSASGQNVRLVNRQNDGQPTTAGATSDHLQISFGQICPKLQLRLARNPPKLLALLLYREAMVEHGGDHGNQHTGGKHNNVILAESQQGNSRAYSLDRVVREIVDYQNEQQQTTAGDSTSRGVDG